MHGSNDTELDLKSHVKYRDFQSLTQACGWRMNIVPVENGVRVLAFEGATPFYLKSTAATCEPRHDWYLGCYFGEETKRGLNDREDRLFAVLFRARLEVGSSVTLVASTEPAASLDGETARAERANHDVRLFQEWEAKNEKLAEEAPSWLSRVILAADQFIVERSLPEEPHGPRTIADSDRFA